MLQTHLHRGPAATCCLGALGAAHAGRAERKGDALTRHKHLELVRAQHVFNHTLHTPRALQERQVLLGPAGREAGKEQEGGQCQEDWASTMDGNMIESYIDKAFTVREVCGSMGRAALRLHILLPC